MKRYLLATAALAALTTQAQVGGPNRPGPGSSPGTFQQPGSTESSLQQTAPSSSSTSSDRAGQATSKPVPTTSVGTPDATGGPQADSLRTRSSFPSSRDWETGAVGSSASAQSETTTSRRLTPTPNEPVTSVPVNAPESSTAPTSTQGSRRIGSDLNTSGVNTPPRAQEQPLDKALSAKIRAQLSQTPVGAQPVVKIMPETVRDLRITSQNGKVILEGNVASKSEKDVIEIRAKEVQGVASVENKLKVRNESVGSAAPAQSGHSSDAKASDQKSDPSKASDPNASTAPDK